MEVTAISVLVTTVDHQEELFTKRDVRNDSRSRKIAQAMWSPILHTFTTMVDRRSLKDCNVTRDDLCNAKTIYGTDVNAIKGNMVETAHKLVKLNIEIILLKSTVF